jgi:ATP-dependent exoDNAse (exonuclease V) beta subunit
MYDSKDLAEKNEKISREIYFKQREEKTPEWFAYQYKEAEQFILKSSISKILRDQEETENFVGSGSSAERGILYHKFLQEIDFKKEDIDLQIDKVYKKYDSKIDLKLIKDVLKKPIFNEISKAEHILTEREFYAKISTDEILKTHAESDFILQGIFDLVAVFENDLIILDYKTGKFREEKLINYSYQLDMYAKIAEKIFNKKIRKKILCFIDDCKILEI